VTSVGKYLDSDRDHKNWKKFPPNEKDAFQRRVVLKPEERKLSRGALREVGKKKKKCTFELDERVTI